MTAVFQASKEWHPDLSQYQRFVIFFSGGKDSLACALHLLELGIPAERIELHHHLVDGAEGSDLMDWPVTDAYCQAFADHFGFPISYSWRQGGFEREMLRENAPTAPVLVPLSSGGFKKVGGQGPCNTRRMFPQVSADLRVRWCSAYLKVDVGGAWVVANPKFRDGKTLVLTGERAEASRARANYKVFEPYRKDNRNGRPGARRWVDQWRAVHAWSEQEVWDIIKRHRVVPHPSYQLGWGRTSCLLCVFGDDDQWASAHALQPRRVIRISAYEDAFGKTIHRTDKVMDRVARGTPYRMSEEHKAMALSKTWDWPIVTDDWQLPAGAFGKGCGPT